MPEKFPIVLPAWVRELSVHVIRLALLAVLALAVLQLATGMLLDVGTLPAVLWAQRLSPLDHRPELLLTELDPEHAQDHWRRIRKIHPAYSAAWIQLGLDQERGGDLQAAEATLRAAVQRDRMFAPQWALANFYFRQGRAEQFWKHARLAAGVYEGSLTGVLALCLRLEQDPLALLRRLEPRTAAARGELMQLLLRERRYRDASRVAELVAQAKVRENGESLLAACDLALGAGETAAALGFWNAAAGHGLVAGRRLDPERGDILADGGFESAESGRCFGWRVAGQDGVQWRAGIPGGLRMELNGRQAAVLNVARVWIPVEKGGRYQVSWRYSAEFEEGAAPLGWSLNGGATVGEWKRQVRGAESQMEFDAGGRDLIEVTLVSRPGLGWTRPEGRFQLEWVRVRRREKGLEKDAIGLRTSVIP